MTPLTLSIAMSLALIGANFQTEQFFAKAPAHSRIHYSNAAPSSPLSQRDTYWTYSNARYRFSIAYPAYLLVPQGEADNGDGQRFVSKDGSVTLVAFGSNRLDKSLRDEFQSAQADREVTYKVLKRDMFVVTGMANGKIFYQKTLLRGDVFKTFIIEYPEAKRASFDAVTARIARSFTG
jgi:hypothetical protein